MTISSASRLAGPFIGAGSTATFPFTFKAFEETDLYVVTLNTATHAITPLALTTDYTVSLSDDQDTSPGGSITLTAGNLASGLNLTVTTGIAALQGLDLANAGAFYPDVVNAALDLLTVLLQQALNQAARSLQAPITDSALPVLPPAAQRAGNLLAFDSSGNPLMVTLAGTSVLAGQQASGTVDGSNKVFVFGALSSGTPALLVFAGGVFQTLGADYTLGTATGQNWPINFTTAPTQGPITVVLLG